VFVRPPYRLPSLRIEIRPSTRKTHRPVYVPAMPRLLCLLLAIASGPGVASAANVSEPAPDPAIEFIGILALPQKTLFALSTPSSGQSTWVGLEQNFGGYCVAEYDRQTDTLTLTKAGATRRVRLKDDAKVKASRLELNGTVTVGSGEQIGVVRATLVLDEENIFPLKDDITCRIKPERRPDGNILYRVTFERILAANKTERISAPSLVARPGERFSLQMDDFGFAFTPLAQAPF